MKADGRSRLRAALSGPFALHFGVAFFRFLSLTNKLPASSSPVATWFHRSNPPGTQDQITRKRGQT
jgi:hypothetical protein